MPRASTAALSPQRLQATRPSSGGCLPQHPAKLAITGGEWDRPLLHLAAAGGHLACVELLLARGFDVDARDRLDHATALHWAAQDGHLDVVKRLVDAGADIDGEGDDHALGVLGWATCFRDVREEVAAYLLSRGARLHIFSAIALDRGDDVRAMVAAEPELLSRRMSRNEHGRMPLHHAVVCNRPAMVELLLELGADVNAADLAGAAPIAYARQARADRADAARRRRAAGPDRRTDARALRPGRGHAGGRPGAAGAGRTRHHRAASGRRPAQRRRPCAG